MRIPHFILVLSLLGPWGARAQVSQPQENFFGSVNVQLVNLDVVVTDRSGQPVSGLSVGDFELRVDGRPVAIQHFYAPSQPVESTETIAANESESTNPTSQERGSGFVGEAGPRPDRRPTSLVIYIDNFHLEPRTRTRVLRRLREFVEETGAIWDRMMVVSYERSVKLELPFTKDRREVEATLLQLEKRNAYGSQYASDRREVLKYIQETDNPDEVTSRIVQQAEQIRNDLEFSTDALRDFVNSLSGLPGRKVLLHVSDGMAMEPAADLIAAAQARFAGAIHPLGTTGPSLGRTYHEIAAAANSAGVTFYMIDAAGLRASAAMDLAMRAPAPSPLVDSSFRVNQQGPLTLMSDATGGRAILNTNDPTASLHAMARDQQIRYSLAFTPPDGPDERYHRIEVKVDRPGYTVRCRDGYRLRSVDQRLADGVQAMLRYRTQDNPLAAELLSDRGVPDAQGMYSVHLLIQLPYGELAFIPQGTMRSARLEFAIQARDAEGSESPLTRKSLPLEIPESDYAQVVAKPLRYRLDLRMRAGWHTIGVGIRDTIGGKESLVYLDVQVGAG